MGDITSLSTVFPTENDIAEVVREGRQGTEDSMSKWKIADRPRDHIRIDADLKVTDAGVLDVDIAPGEAFISGYRVQVSADTPGPEAGSLTMADGTNFVYLELNRDIDNLIASSSGVVLVSNTSGVTPTDAILLAIVQVSGGDIDYVIDRRASGLIQPVALIIPEFSTSSTSFQDTEEVYFQAPEWAKFLNVFSNVAHDESGGSSVMEYRYRVTDKGGAFDDSAILSTDDAADFGGADGSGQHVFSINISTLNRFLRKNISGDVFNNAGFLKVKGQCRRVSGSIANAVLGTEKFTTTGSDLFSVVGMSTISQLGSIEW